MARLGPEAGSALLGSARFRLVPSVRGESDCVGLGSGSAWRIRLCWSACQQIGLLVVALWRLGGLLL